MILRLIANTGGDYVTIGDAVKLGLAILVVTGLIVLIAILNEPARGSGAH